MRTFVWFSYRGDEAPLQRSLRAVRLSHPEARRVVVGDAAAPFSPAMTGFLDREGVIAEESSWNRGGNLNGWPATLGIWDVLARHAAASDWVAKVDSDTMVLRSIPEIIASKYNPPRVTVGVFYQFPARLIPSIRDALAAMARDGRDTRNIGEDFALTLALRSLGMATRVRCAVRAGLAEQYRGETEALARRSRMVFCAPAVRPYWTPGRQEVAAVMDRLGRERWGNEWTASDPFH